MSKKQKHKNLKRIFSGLERKARQSQRAKHDVTARASSKPPVEHFVGQVSATQKGYGFLVREGEERDLFIPAEHMGGAMHGDTVRARRLQEDTPSRAGTCAVTEILSRGVTTFVGTLHVYRINAAVEPDDKRLGQEIWIEHGDTAGGLQGQKVVCEMVDYPDGHFGASAKVIEVLGYPDQVGVDVLSIIRAHGLYEEFPTRVLDEAHAAPASVTEADVQGRADFRNDLTITIDGEDAKDLDDAITVTETQDGYRLCVHIADVSHYVREGSALDKEAFARGTSVYFPDRVLPMIPKELSNGICSLNQGVDRLTLSCVMTFTPDGERTKTEITKGVISSDHRMTYTAVQGILDGDSELCAQYADVLPMLTAMQRLERLLVKKRKERGAIDFTLPETKVVIDPQTGKITGVAAYPRYEAHRIIEEFMLAANTAVAEKFERLGVPFVYRVHEAPSEEKLDVFSTFIAPFGLSLNRTKDGIAPRDMQALLTEIEGKPYERVVSRVGLRSMQKAKYAPTCDGHFGLALTHYAHFTSPIRRYPDLSIHRIISAYLADGKDACARFRGFAASSAEQSSVRERLAEEAEREVDDLKKAEYMEDHIGEVFTGVVSGVTAFGLFVELENTCEGLVRMETLPDDTYVCDEERFELRGMSRTFRLGDELTVMVVSASKEDRHIDFVLCDDDTAPRESFVPEIKRMVMPGERKEAYAVTASGIAKAKGRKKK